MKQNVFSMSACILAGLGLTAGLAINLPTQAATNFKRTKTTKISKKYFYSTSNTGQTYKFIGGTKKFHFKTNHALKNYQHTTWVASGKTRVTKHGKNYTYYTVKNAKNGASGWVAASYLKPGRNYMMTAVKQTAKSNKIMRKAGKIYQLKGNHNQVSFINGKALSAKMTYVVSQKRTVYKTGKAYTYYYVTGKANQTRGWVWSGFVKAGSYEPTKRVTNSTPNSSSHSINASKEAFNVNQVANDVAQLLSKERAKIIWPSGITSGAVSVDATLQQVANARSSQLVKNFSHDYEGHDAVTPLAKQYGIYDSYFATEDLIGTNIYDTNMETADSIVQGFKYGDSAHWNDLTNPDFTKIGVGIGIKSSDQQTGYVAIELGY